MDSPNIISSASIPKTPQQIVNSLLVPIILMFAFTALGFGMGGYYLGMKNANKANEAKKALPAATDAPHQEELDGWISYSNETYSFSLKVPAEINMEPSDSDNEMKFSNESGDAALSIEAFTGEEAATNFQANCSTKEEESNPPFEGGREFHKYEDRACWLVGDDKYINVNNRALEDSQFNKIISTFTFN